MNHKHISVIQRFNQSLSYIWRLNRNHNHTFELFDQS